MGPRILWEKTGLRSTRTGGSWGIRLFRGLWTNPEQFLGIISALDLSIGVNGEQKRVRLVGLIHNGEVHSKGAPYYNLRCTPEMHALEDEIKRGTRNRAIEHGVEVRVERR